MLGLLLVSCWFHGFICCRFRRLIVCFWGHLPLQFSSCSSFSRLGRLSLRQGFCIACFFLGQVGCLFWRLQVRIPGCCLLWWGVLCCASFSIGCSPGSMLWSLTSFGIWWVCAPYLLFRRISGMFLCFRSWISFPSTCLFCMHFACSSTWSLLFFGWSLCAWQQSKYFLLLGGCWMCLGHMLVSFQHSSRLSSSWRLCWSWLC